MSSPATIIKPNQGKTFSFLGNTITCKFNRNSQGERIYEFLATASSGVPPLHSHPWDESFYFLEGEVAFQVETETIEATSGCYVNLPAGVAHTFQVRSPQAKFLVWVSNAAAETYINELAQAAQDPAFTLEAVNAIAQKHHIQFVKANK